MIRPCPFSRRRVPGSLRFLFVVLWTSSRGQRRLLRCFLRTWWFPSFASVIDVVAVRSILILSVLEIKTILLNAQLFSLVARYVRIKAA